MKRLWVVLFVGFTLAGCTPQYAGNPSGRRVALWGDSTMDLERDAIPAQLNDRYQTSLEAHPGYTLAALQDVATRYALAKPDVVVISAGGMDAWIVEAPWNGVQELLTIGATISKYSSCVVWVNIWNGAGVPPPGVNPIATQRADAFNAALTYWATVYPNLRIVDWNGTVLAEGVDKVLQPGNPHANQVGQTLMAKMIDQAVSTC